MKQQDPSAGTMVVWGMDRSVLTSLLESKGFVSIGIVSLRSGGAYRTIELDGYRAVAIAALPYHGNISQDLSTPKDPHLLVAPFGWANYYRIARTLLHEVVGEIMRETGRRRREFKPFVNSRLPEKLLALEAGVGFQGKNSLIITRKSGSLVVLAGILLPFVPDGAYSPNREPSRCGGCSRCVKECPTGAIQPEGGVDTGRCLQAMATGDLPMHYWGAWGTRLYGCQRCQEVCPYNKEAGAQAPLSTYSRVGYLGSSLSLRLLLSNGSDIKGLFPGSILDRSWIASEKLLRNALIGAGNHPDGSSLRHEIAEYIYHPDSVVRSAARYALSRLTGA